MAPELFRRQLEAGAWAITAATVHHVQVYRRAGVQRILFANQLTGAGTPDQLRACLQAFYADAALVRVHGDTPDELLLRRSTAPWDGLDLYVFGAKDGSQARLVAVLDNLGKGASGAAVQSLNLMANLPETAGLRV